MEEQTYSGPKKAWTKKQAMTVIGVGAFMLLLAFIIPTEEGSTAYVIKCIGGIVGIIVGCVGAYFRPMKAPKDAKQ